MLVDLPSWQESIDQLTNELRLDGEAEQGRS